MSRDESLSTASSCTRSYEADVSPPVALGSDVHARAPPPTLVAQDELNELVVIHLAVSSRVRELDGVLDLVVRELLPDERTALAAPPR